jgi:hypothetical protein
LAEANAERETAARRRAEVLGVTPEEPIALAKVIPIGLTPKSDSIDKFRRARNELMDKTGGRSDS